MKPPWLLAALLPILAGIALFSHGASLSLYRDEPEFQRRYVEIDPRRPGAKQRYRALRREFLTKQILYEDYGVMMILLGTYLLAVPSSVRLLLRWESGGRGAPALGMLAALGTVAGSVALLLIDAARGEFPWFADALIIPIISLPLVLIVLLLWMGLNWLVVRHALRSPQEKSLGLVRGWIGLLLAGSAVAVFWSAGRADYFAFIPNLVWFGFYFLLFRMTSTEAGWPRYEWQRHGPWWGALAGGLLLPAAVFCVTVGLLHDTGGPLFWPILCILLGGIGIVVGDVTKKDWRQQRYDRIRRVSARQ